jgi:hypothetical protein
MNLKVPITSPLWQVRLTQAGLAPSDATMRMAHLLEAIRQDQRARQQAQKGEGDDKG